MTQQEWRAPAAYPANGIKTGSPKNKEIKMLLWGWLFAWFSGAGHAQLRVYSGSGWTYKSKLCTLMSASSFLVHIRLESKDYTHRGCNEGSRSRSAGKRWPSRKSLQFLGHGCFSLNLCIHHLTSVTHLLFFNLHLQLIVTSEIIPFKYTDLERKGEDPWPFLSHKRRRSRFSY